MANSPFPTVQFDGAEVVFMLGANDDPATVENMDVEVVLGDGSRWSATFLTLAEIRRVMDRWAQTGECLNGTYFQCTDLVIFEHGGIEAATDLVRRLVESGEIRDAFVQLDPEN